MNCCPVRHWKSRPGNQRPSWVPVHDLFQRNITWCSAALQDCRFPLPGCPSTCKASIRLCRINMERHYAEKTILPQIVSFLNCMPHIFSGNKNSADKRWTSDDFQFWNHRTGLRHSFQAANATIQIEVGKSRYGKTTIVFGAVVIAPDWRFFSRRF